MINTLQCLDCRHFRKPAATGPLAYTCGAFPGGIPRPILLSHHDHREPFDGDRGIRFEPIDAEGPPWVPLKPAE